MNTKWTGSNKSLSAQRHLVHQNPKHKHATNNTRWRSEDSGVANIIIIVIIIIIIIDTRRRTRCGSEVLGIINTNNDVGHNANGRKATDMR